MSERTFRLRNHRKLPGQSSLDESSWAEVEAESNDAYWRETHASVREGRANRVDLPANLKALRLRLDLKQAELADQLDVSLRSLQMYERGERPVPSDVLSNLYAIYDIDIHKLFVSTSREPGEEWKLSLSKMVLNVEAHVRYAWPNLNDEEVASVTCEYMKEALPGQPIDEFGIMMCYDRLFQPMDYDSGDHDA